MPIASTKEFEHILMHLSVLRYIFKSKSKHGHYDLNKAAENFFRDFLNLAFGYELINVNDISNNYAAIDLADVKERLCIQVTADNSSTKIKESLRKFEKYNLNDDYDRFVMLLLTEKKGYSTDFSVSSIIFDPIKDIWDVDDLLERIEGLPLDKKSELAALLSKEMRPLFAQFADVGSIFKAQPVAKQPAVTAARVLALFDYDPRTGDGDRIFGKIHALYSALSNVSKQARICLHTVITRGKEKHGGIHITTQEYENLLSSISRDERVGNFHTLVDANLVYADEGEIIAGWGLEPGADFFVLAGEMFQKEGVYEEAMERLIIDADFSLLDQTK